MTLPPADKSAPEAQDAVPAAPESDQSSRFRVACRLLRNGGWIDAVVPGQRRGESQIDWLVRIGVAVDKYHAADALIVAHGLTRVLNETVQYLDNESAAASGGETPDVA